MSDTSPAAQAVQDEIHRRMSGEKRLKLATAVTADLFIVSSPNWRVYGLDRRTGQVRWTTKGSGPYDRGVVAINDVAITAGDAGRPGLRRRHGAQRWKVNVGGNVLVPLTPYGKAVLAVTGRLWAVSADGNLLWRHDAGETVPYSTGARVQNDIIYIGTSYGDKIGFFALRAPD
ncbi:MAG: PQQ-binding-like beta-propeller repeat protein [Gemmatimonadetes bacterium]|nr:PQQ-binding-like beta-propeller repeat protein [Gemmatimonadota bacterium]